MSDLRTLHRTLVGAAVVTTPPYEAVVGRARSIRRQHSTAAMVGVALVAVLASMSLRSISFDDAADDRTHLGGAGTTSTFPPAETSPEGGDGSPASGSSQKSPELGGEPAPLRAEPRSTSAPPVQCAWGANGGATGKGVTADRIHLLGAVDLDGPAKSMVEDVPLAWKVVMDAVNRSGGICGRTVTISVTDGLLRTPSAFAGQDAVGILLAPLDPDVGDRVRDGSVDSRGIPIVGGDAGERAQFSSPWLWPVDLPMAAFARIGVDEAYRTGARTFAVVYDSKNDFASDVPGAMGTYVATLDGAQLRNTAALDPDDPAYATTSADLRAACGQTGCDAVVLALHPETAKKWLQTSAALGTRRTAAPASLLSEGFARDCVREKSADACGAVRFWPGLTPPIASFADEPDMARYIDSLGEDAGMNPWTTSGYVAAQVMVAALQRAGPKLDRASLRAALDDLDYQSSFVAQLDWTPTIPSGRAGNTAARAIAMKTTVGVFREFVDAGTGWVRDPWPGRFPD